MFYVYGIVRKDAIRSLEDYPGIGKPSSRVKSITVDAYDLIVSEVDHLEKLDPEDVVAHSNVLDQLFAESEVIPVKFGTLSKDPSDLSLMIHNNRDKLRDTFKKIQGRMEVGLKIYWQQSAVQTKIQERLDVARARKESGQTGEGFYALEIKIGQIAQEIVEEWRDVLIRTIDGMITPLADDVTTGKLISVYMLCNLSFLIKRSKREIFRDQIFKLETKFGRDCQINYVDNLPPFNFIDLKLGS
jgi:hypothetical protein